VQDHRNLHRCLVVLRILPIAFVCSFGLALPAAAAVDFAAEILPILQRACFECHGAEVQKGGLQLHQPTLAFTTGDHAPVIVPGDPDRSELLRRVALPPTDKAAMPRRGARLTPAEIERLHRWIAAGADWPAKATSAAHWAYQKPQKPQLPTVQQPDWVRNPIDTFILARLETERLQPAPPAAPAVLARRLYLALIGLPPTPAQVAAFEKALRADPATATEHLVDQLLDSPEFGVRWARPWLDLARYADSHGFQRDDLRQIWGFRDWVVQALNADLPFDQFTIEQVAGDLLPQPTPSQIIATGFHRCTPTNVEAGTEPEESRIHQVLDRVNTTGAVWLGSSLECAQCHDHKYDPFSQRDYYQLMAYFNNTEQEADRTNPKVPGSIAFNGSPFEMREAAPTTQRLQLEAEQATLRQRLTTEQPDADAAFEAWLTKQRADLAHPPTEHPLEVIEFTSEQGAHHRELEDGSILLSGPAPATDTYRLVLKAPALKNLTGLKLEALTHDSLPGNGPGRGDAERPNFVLNTLELRLRSADANDDPGRLLLFSGATADFAQNRFDPSGAIDDDPATGWAINPQFGQPHWALFELAQPLDLSEHQELVVTLVQQFGGSRTLGRVRLQAVTGGLATTHLPPTLASLLQRPRLTAQQRARLREHFDLTMPAMATLRTQLSKLERQLAALTAPVTEVMKELPQPRQTTLFERGEYTAPGAPVQPATPAILPALKGPPTRLGLAQWLVSSENPLTARVTVNRWWAELFGQGLVTTVEDFGIKGAPPTHPELLDWLAVTFMEQGWSMKQLLRLIATSATFSQDARFTPALVARDPTNSLYARGPRLRLDAEAIRDNALAIAGLLSLQKGGPPIYPPQPAGLWKKVGGQQYDYTVSTGEKQYRRGLYVVLKRGSPNPSLVNFDASARLACVVQRSRSNTPLQALTLLNDPVYVQAATAFAARIQKETAQAPLPEQVRHAFRLAIARSPTPSEVAVLTQLHQTQRDLGNTAATAWFAVATALLNLDECITRN